MLGVTQIQILDFWRSGKKRAKNIVFNAAASIKLGCVRRSNAVIPRILKQPNQNRQQIKQHLNLIFEAKLISAKIESSFKFGAFFQLFILLRTQVRGHKVQCKIQQDKNSTQGQLCSTRSRVQQAVMKV